MRILEQKYEMVLLDFNYLSSPEKLMEYQAQYFENELKEVDITNLKKLTFLKNEIQIKEFIDLLNNYKANIVGIICIVNRSQKNIKFNNRFDSLLNFPSESWEEDKCPEWLMEIPITKPGSTGK